MSPQQKRIMKLTAVTFKGFWKSHVTVLGSLIQGLLSSQRAGVAAVGRALPGETSPKHKIKRVDYFLYQGRSLPLFWAAMDPKQMYRSMNRFEYTFFQLLKQQVLPTGVQCVLLLDRCFRRVNLLKQLEALEYGYVVRSGGTTHMEHRYYQGKMQNWITRRGQLKELNAVEVRQTQAIKTRVVGRWDKGQKEPWTLANFRQAFQRYQATEVLA